MFESVMKEAEGLWAIAEPCLYHCYQKRNETIDRLLERLYRTGKGADLETWGRISALVTLTGRTDFTAFLANLNNLDAAEAWRGAASVWGHPENLSRHTALCLGGIEAGFNADKTYAIVVANQLRKFFHSKALVSVPIALLKRCFEIFRSNAGTHPEIFGIDEWLNTSAHNDPIYALCAAEIYLNYVGQTSQDLYEHDNQLTQLLTCLFAEAEEREESDGGAMLLRVVALQDVLLGLGVSSVGDWLKAAERP